MPECVKMMWRHRIAVATGAALIAAVCPIPGSPSSASERDLHATTSMHTARAAHTATALLNGNVLIFGGFSADESKRAGAERYDHLAGQFAVIPPPRMLRQSHSATRLLDGSVLIAGGYGDRGTITATAELFDPAKGEFTKTHNMTTPRAGHMAVLLDDGRVLIVGGTGPKSLFLAGAEIYNPATGLFTETGRMTEPRESHIAVNFGQGRILIAGGHRGNGRSIVVSRTAEIYDVTMGQFRPTGDMLVRRHKHDAVAVGDGRVLILGGADEHDNQGVYASVEIFDAATGQFHAGSPMRLGRYKHNGTTVVLAADRLLLAGGATQAEEYNPLTGESVIVGSNVRMAGQFCATAVLPGGRVLITGGYGEGRGPIASAWVYEPAR